MVHKPNRFKSLADLFDEGKTLIDGEYRYPDDSAQRHLLTEVEDDFTDLTPAKASRVKRCRKFMVTLIFWSMIAIFPAVYVTWWSV